MKQKKMPPNWDYTKRTSQEQAKTAMVERGMKQQNLRIALGSLDALQASRPAKPPGKR